MVASNTALLPGAVVDAALADELPPALAWAKRRGIRCEWVAERRELRLQLRQKVSGEPYYLGGQFDSYRALPAAWQWFDSTWALSNSIALSPKPVPSRFGGSMFMTKDGRAIICAPFNRLAHAAYNGPHSDWGELANWAAAGGNHIRATRIGDMLQAIWRDFSLTSERAR